MDFLTPEVQKELLGFISSLVGLALAVLGVVGSYLLVKVKAYFVAKIGTEQLDWLESYIRSSVAAVAQNPLYESIANDLKKDEVKLWALNFCQLHGLNFTDEQIDALIEGAVADWKEYHPKEK